jgi:hypothetical protein
VAQSREGVTHRGLAQVDPLTRAGNVSLLHHRIEHNEQVEINRAQIRPACDHRVAPFGRPAVSNSYHASRDADNALPACRGLPYLSIVRLRRLK